MSRIGKQPIKVPSGVTVSVDGQTVVVNGPKGSLSQPAMESITIDQSDGSLIIKRSNEEATTKAKHGLMRSLVSNMVEGVSEGFKKQLEINGVGYRVNSSGNELKFSLGLSHPVSYKLPEGITAAVEQNIITISGIDKQKVGQVAAEIRALKKPEPYKGKGIKYVDERIIRKSGKSGKEK